MFGALDFLAELTQHIPPKGLQLMRRNGLYAYRTKGRWSALPWVTKRAPEGWKATHPPPPSSQDLGYESLSEFEDGVDFAARFRT